MCIAALAWQILPERPLLLLSNRDEFYARQAEPLAEWTDSPMIAGRDCLSQGTWLGMTKQGRWAVLTNYREPADHSRGAQLRQARSRGLLVTDYLHSDTPPGQFARQLAAVRGYAGFNLMLGDLSQAYVFSNRGTSPTPLASGLYVLSNGLIDCGWPKMENLRQRIIQEVLPLMAHTRAGDPLPHAVIQAGWQVLHDRRQADEAHLPQTGLSQAWEKQLSSIFIEAPTYGTRVSSLLTLDLKGYAFFEKTHVPRLDQAIRQKTGFWQLS